MPRISIAACAMALCFTVPAFAQNSMSSSATPAAATSAMTCAQMMAQADRMSTSSTGARMTMAQNERHAANVAKANNDEAGCKTHMAKAMQYMK